MKKLELKHIAPYLPYNVFIIRNDTFKTIGKLRLLITDTEEVGIRDITNSLCSVCYLSQINLILRPLSDLSKEIEMEGKKFVPIDRILDNHSFVTDIHISKFRKFKIIQEQIHILKDIKELGYKYCDYWFLQYLLEWHFDIFGLIEQNLAIDINTINL